MKLPTTYDDDILGYERGFYPDKTPARSSVYSLVFPPIGFFPSTVSGMATITASTGRLIGKKGHRLSLSAVTMRGH